MEGEIPNIVYTREEWESTLNSVKIRKSEMNRIVMNLLVAEGFVEAAERFRDESRTHLDPASTTNKIQSRNLGEENKELLGELSELQHLLKKLFWTEDQLEKSAVYGFPRMSELTTGTLRQS